MRKVALASAAVAVVLGLAGVVAIAAASQAAEPATAKSKALTFDVVFSPFTLVAANNVRDPNSRIALGDEIVFHDQLFSAGRRVGDTVGSCVVASISPEALANCSVVFRLQGGNIAAQFVAVQGPTPRDVAVTGGTGSRSTCPVLTAHARRIRRSGSWVSPACVGRDSSRLEDLALLGRFAKVLGTVSPDGGRPAASRAGRGAVSMGRLIAGDGQVSAA